MRERLIGHGDIADVVDLMRTIGVHFAGCRSPIVLRAVAHDAVAHPENVIIALAVETRPVGLVVAFRERTSYWRSFVRRHPIATLAIARHRISRMRRRARGPIVLDNTLPQTVRALFADHIDAAMQQQWSDEQSSVAKVMYVAVHPQARGAGTGRQLYRWFFRYLADTGVTRCDAQVSGSNVGAAKLHRQFPFRVRPVAGGYFLSLMTHDVAP